MAKKKSNSKKIQKEDNKIIKRTHKVSFGVLLVLIIAIIVAVSVGDSKPENTATTVVLETSKGDIHIELFEDLAPVTTQNFLDYVNSGFYDGLIFHRVIPGFMVQGGGFFPSGEQKPTNPPIQLETIANLSNKVGTIAMARTNDPNSATSQFFINVADNAFLNPTAQNPGYAVFGNVTKGMDVVIQIENVQTTTKGFFQDWPVEDVVIIRAYVLE